MDEHIIKQLQEYFPVKRVKGFNNSGWFLIEITPFPPADELPLIVSDIINDRTIDVSSNGQVRHYLDCHHEHPVPANIKKILSKLKEQTFLVAVHPGNFNVYQGQPIAIAIEPKITYTVYPDHPHLNVGNVTMLDGKQVFLPDSFCYTDRPFELGFDPVQRLIKGISMISIWLLRHQIWLLTREHQFKREWIGPEADPFKPEEYPLFLNPNGLCRCGKNSLYKTCHMSHDIELLLKQITEGKKEGYSKVQVFNSISNWNMYRGNPQEQFINEFKNL